MLAAFLPCLAQNDLSESDKKAIQARVKDKVDEFQYHLKCIVDTDLSDYQRKSEIGEALKLFIGNGGKYSVTNYNGDVENRSPVQMQISSINKSVTRTRQMAKYLEDQYRNVHSYGKVIIEAADVVRVDNINKISNGHYEAMAYFVQKYIAFKDGKIVYSDITTKKVKVYIDALPIPGGVIWEAKLGDVYITATRPYGDG